MKGRIPQTFLDGLMDRVDIVSLIDARVPLRKAGRDYKACCPFHDEKTPSFNVSPSKQFYYCFGCGASGNALQFLMDYEHQGFLEAVEELAGIVGVEVPREAMPLEEAGLRDLYPLLEEVDRRYQMALRQHPTAAMAVDYLKGRGVSGEVAARYHLGFAPPGWDFLLQDLGKDPQRRRALLDLGLLVERDSGDGHYDRFRERVMFPIRDRRGRVIGFGGRILGDGTPKYMNSPESGVFHKGRELYGLYEARQARRRIERLLVVEGYMDVVALAQFGIDYAVATLGTATTPEHLDALFRVVPEVVFCFDGDAAGRKAAWKALDQALPLLQAGRQVRFLYLPEEEDPDTLVRAEGTTAFEQRIADAKTLSDTFFEGLAEDVDLQSIDGRALLAERARPLIARLPKGYLRELMGRRLSEISGVAVPRRPVGERRRTLPTRLGGQALSPMARTMAMLLQRPDLAPRGDILLQDVPVVDVAGLPLLREILELLREQPNLTTGALVEHWREHPQGTTLRRLAVHPLEIPEDGWEEEFSGLACVILEQVKAQRFQELRQKQRLGLLDEPEKGEFLALLQGGRR